MTTTTVDIPGLRTLVQGKPAQITEASDPIALLASPDAMMNWLASLRPTSIVGRSESAHECPIATFLAARGIEAWVGGVQFGITGSMNVRVLPDWAYRFVQLVDRYEHQPIRASLATTLLHQAVGDVA